MYEQRIETVRHNLASRGLEQMLVCDPRSIHYLTGAFIEPDERFLGLIVGSDARPTLVLNALLAAPADAVCTVRSFTDIDDPLPFVKKLCDADKPLDCDKNLPASIVSFGANAADPHHEPDDTPLASGDVVLFDVSCRKGEYCSDMTRTSVLPTKDEANESFLTWHFFESS